MTLKHEDHIDPFSLPYNDLPLNPPSVRVDLLHGGYIRSTRRFWADDAHDENVERRKAKLDAKHDLPIFCAAFTRTLDDGENQTWLWDLGLANDTTDMPEAFTKFPLGEFDLPNHAQPHIAWPSHSINLSEIKGMILSHAHFDHFGALDQYPIDIPVYWGPGSTKWVGGGHLKGGLASFPTKYLQQERKFVEFDDDMKGMKKIYGVGPFEEGWDLFGDHSVFVVKAPGHCIGHMGLLAHTGSNDWVFLAGDSGHAQSLYMPIPPKPYSHATDKRSIPAEFHRHSSGDGKDLATMQDFPDEAFKNLARLSRLESTDNVMVLLAHEDEFARTNNLNSGDVFNLNNWKERGLKEAKDEEGARHMEELNKLTG